MHYHTLYLHLAQRLRPLLRPAKNTHVSTEGNLALLTLSLAVSPNCHLATLATVLPITGQRENLIQHLRRVLKDADGSRRQAYRGVIRHLLASWTAQEIALVMDRTDLEDRLSILMLALAYGKRALPLAWHVLDFGGTNAELQMNLLNQVASWIPEGPRVTFFGDAEFRAVEVQRQCQRRCWHWQVGLKSDLLFRCHSSPYNGPGVFTHTGPSVFTHSGPASSSTLGQHLHPRWARRLRPHWASLSE